MSPLLLNSSASRQPELGSPTFWCRQRPDDIDRLLELGDSLRGSGDALGGDEIRKVSKQRIDAVAKLVRYAKSRASQSGHPASTSAVVELEMTLDAAFADPEAAAKLRQGRLTTGLRYSGLGFAAPPDTGSSTRQRALGPLETPSPRRSGLSGHANCDKANHEAEQADAQVEKTRQAIKEATAELTRLKSTEAQAVQRSRDAHARAAAAEKRLSKGGSAGSGVSR